MSDSATTPAKRRRRWPWIAGAFALLALALHEPLLCGLASLLIADDAGVVAPYVLIVSGDRRYQFAADRAAKGDVQQVLYVEEPFKRLARLGIELSWGQSCIRELTRRGVPKEMIAAIPGEAKEPWQRARCVQAWLEEHPGERLQVLCERFESGGERYVWSRVMSPGELARVSFTALPDRRFDETDWYRNRLALRAVTGAAMDRAYFALHGEDTGAPPPWDPDEYERMLR